VPGEFERLTYEAALRGLDKQERLLEELRARTGALLTASSLATSFLGPQAFRRDSGDLLTVVALAAFIVSIGTSVFILLPKRGLVFSEAGFGLFSALHSMRTDMPGVHRRMAYELDRLWTCNDRIIGTLTRAYIVGSCALAVEILSLAALVSATLL
jgi:hypothetical protein